ncbi:MAG: ACT domain-containing protein [Clostridia bacterium]|nr:ACT domain-containing protein [Clostridia bacterium]
MKLKRIDGQFTVCQVPALDPALLSDPYCFIGKTDEELSLVCLSDRVPTDAQAREDGWRAFRIEGVLDFSLVGILAPIAGALAQAGIGIFAVSTFNTDYVLVKAGQLDHAMDVLEGKGYIVE